LLRAAPSSDDLNETVGDVSLVDERPVHQNEGVRVLQVEAFRCFDRSLPRRSERSDIENCRKHGVDIVRRISGGGTVYHDCIGEITYSVVLDGESLISLPYLKRRQILAEKAGDIQLTTQIVTSRKEDAEIDNYISMLEAGQR
jgi:hypothetical protein